MLPIEINQFTMCMAKKKRRDRKGQKEYSSIVRDGCEHTGLDRMLCFCGHFCLHSWVLELPLSCRSLKWLLNSCSWGGGNSLEQGLWGHFRLGGSYGRCTVLAEVLVPAEMWCWIWIQSNYLTTLLVCKRCTFPHPGDTQHTALFRSFCTALCSFQAFFMWLSHIRQCREISPLLQLKWETGQQLKADILYQNSAGGEG